MRIAIGILAWNEEKSLPALFASLLEQTLLSDPPAGVEAVEVLVVANGCTDRTVAVAGEVLGGWRARLPAHVTTRVCDLTEAGKANAWNVLVHELADPQADVLVVMDADIWFIEKRTLANLVQALERHPDADVAVDVPVKDIALKAEPGLLDRLSIARSRMWLGGPPVLVGHLYAGRGSALRRIWMPLGLFHEDHFLRQMVVTRRFTAEADERRIVRADDASHVFGAYTSLASVVRHERLMAVGSVVTAVLYDFLRAARTDAGALIRDLNARDPGWLRALVRGRFAEMGWWRMPSPFSLRRFHRLRRAAGRPAVTDVLAALAGTCLDAFVFATANWSITDDSPFRWTKSR